MLHVRHNTSHVLSCTSVCDSLIEETNKPTNSSSVPLFSEFAFMVQIHYHGKYKYRFPRSGTGQCTASKCTGEQVHYQRRKENTRARRHDVDLPTRLPRPWAGRLSFHAAWTGSRAFASASCVPLTSAYPPQCSVPPPARPTR